MNLIPAIDLRGGRCVRLLEGDFDRETEYSKDPLEVAQRFSALAVADLHVVDLDGAQTGAQANVEIVRQIAEESALNVQLGGGIRDEATVRLWLDQGVGRCVIGSMAVSEPQVVTTWIGKFGADRLTLALDVRVIDGEPALATHGWTRQSDETLWEALDYYVPLGIKHVLCTDISRDGALAGPGLELYRAIVTRFPDIQLQASGGIRNRADIAALAEAGVPAAISGRALLDGRITAEEVLQFRQSA